MPFLPPECLNAVVLQATFGEGTVFGSGSVSPAESRRRTADEFRQHAREVSGLWGRRLLQSRTIFLAGSDVLRLPQEDVKAYLSAIAEVFPIEAAGSKDSRRSASESVESSPRFEGVHIFLDDVGAGRPVRSAWAAFAALGLSRVSLGVVSGDRAVRSLYHQAWSDEDLRAAFADLKSAGIGASVLTVVGAGGIEHAESHVAQTVALIISLDLRPGDFVFLLDENELYAPDDPRPALAPLPAAAWQEEQSKLKEGLAVLKARKVKVLPYSMEKQGI